MEMCDTIFFAFPKGGSISKMRYNFVLISKMRYNLNVTKCDTIQHRILEMSRIIVSHFGNVQPCITPTNGGDDNDNDDNNDDNNDANLNNNDDDYKDD